MPTVEELRNKNCKELEEIIRRRKQNLSDITVRTYAAAARTALQKGIYDVLTNHLYTRKKMAEKLGWTPHNVDTRRVALMAVGAAKKKCAGGWCDGLADKPCGDADYLTEETELKLIRAVLDGKHSYYNFETEETHHYITRTGLVTGYKNMCGAKLSRSTCSFYIKVTPWLERVEDRPVKYKFDLGALREKRDTLEAELAQS